MKYFKIIDSARHEGIVYKEGYNEDPLPFNPSGSCEPGGLYFASKDIFAFYDYGTLVYEVEPVGEIYNNPGEPQKFKAHALNMKLLGDKYDLDVIKYLIENGADVHVDDDFLFDACAYDGKLEVKYLYKIGVSICPIGSKAS